MKGRALRLRMHGFTLVELLAVIAIIATVMAIGAPSYRSITTSSRLSTEVNALLVDMQFARSQALRQGLQVTTCISTNGTQCVDSKQWQGGWIVFADVNRNGQVDDDEPVLRVQKGFAAGDSLVASDERAAVTFNRSGFAMNLPNAGIVMKLKDPTSNSFYTRCLSLSMTGIVAAKSHVADPDACS